MTMTDLAKAFDEAMFSIFHRAKAEAGYRATVFLDMVATRGGLQTARYLVNTPKPSDGYTHLYERGRLDLTVEAMVAADSRWHSLFTVDELDKARKRLRAYAYQAHESKAVGEKQTAEQT